MYLESVFWFWSVLCSKKCLFIFQSFFSTRDFVLVRKDNSDINISFLSGSGSGNYYVLVLYSTVWTLDYRICFTCNTFVPSQNCNVCIWPFICWFVFGTGRHGEVRYPDRREMGWCVAAIFWLDVVCPSFSRDLKIFCEVMSSHEGSPLSQKDAWKNWQTYFCTALI